MLCNCDRREYDQIKGHHTLILIEDVDRTSWHHISHGRSDAREEHDLSRVHVG